MLSDDEPPDPQRASDVLTIARIGKRVVNACSKKGRWLPVLGAVIACAMGFLPPASAQTTVAKTSRPAQAQSELAEAGKSSEGTTSIKRSVTLRGSQAPALDPVVVVTRSSLREMGGRTFLELTLSGPAPATAFTVSNPDRVVLDLPEIDFQLPEGAGQDALGLIRSFRYGQLGVGRSRIVIDTAGPVQVVRSEVVRRDQAYLLITEVAAADSRSRWDTATQVSPSGAAPAHAPPGKFVVVIDPGHGGIDAGAANTLAGLAEKDIVLAVAKQLKAGLESRGGYDVRLTRTGDTFVSLDRRVQISESAGAHLFVSLHADAVGDPLLAQSARGATVYTLSEQASSEAARAVAEKENAADGAAGGSDLQDIERVQVNAILADLAKRQTQGFSAEFQHLLIERMRPEHVLARDPLRSASFKVLRQAHVPTVLVELGFISHQGDASQMQMADWQRRVASVIAGAIETFASKHNRVAK